MTSGPAGPAEDAPPAVGGVAYWRGRAQALGARAVVNLDHPDAASLDAVSEGHRAVLLPLLAAALDGSERVVLDLGCGSGRLTADLARAVGGRAVGVDPVPELLALAPADPRVDHHLMVEGVVPLPDDAVDVVFTSLVLGGIEGDALHRTTDEMRRVLRPGGLVFVSESVAEHPESGHWTARTVEEYVALMPWATLREVGRFDDAGDAVAVLSGRA